MKNYRITILLVLLSLIPVSGLIAQNHFQPVWTGNPYLPMNVYVTQASIGSQALSAGDEIGVFDGALCVGAKNLSAAIPADGYASIITSADDPLTSQTDGYISGHTITYKLWKSSSSTEITSVTPIYSMGDGIFTAQGTMVVKLNAAASGTVKVKFQVNMSVYINSNDFNTVTDTVFLSGSINNWVSSIPLADANHDGIYETTLDLQPGSQHTYKYFMKSVSNIGYGWEGYVGPGKPYGDRIFQAPQTDYVMPVVYFNNYETARPTDNSVIVYSSSAYKRDVIVSPDGKKIAFYESDKSNFDGNRDSYIADISSDYKASNVTLITALDRKTWGNWGPVFRKPLGNEVYFFTDREVYWDIMKYDISTQGQSFVLRDPAYGGTNSIRFSPNGTKFVGDRDVNGTHEIVIYNSDGSETKPILRVPWEVCPDWSPDGSKIVYTLRDTIFTISTDGTNNTFIFSTGFRLSYARWSPDGKKFAFEYKGNIYTVDADGQNLTQITNTDEVATQPEWDPSGNRIYYISRRNSVYAHILSIPLQSQSFITINSPTGGENWAVGAAHNITWSSNNISNVKIEYSTNSGTNWLNIVSSTPAGIGSYSWTVPNSPSTNCKIRISNAVNSSIFSISPSVFSIGLATGSVDELMQDAKFVLKVETNSSVDISSLLSSNTSYRKTIQDNYIYWETPLNDYNRFQDPLWNGMAGLNSSVKIKFAINSSGVIYIGSFGENLSEHLSLFTGKENGLQNYLTFDDSTLENSIYGTPKDFYSANDLKQNRLGLILRKEFVRLQKGHYLTSSITSNSDLYKINFALKNNTTQKLITVKSFLMNHQMDYPWFDEIQRPICTRQNEFWSPISKQPDQDKDLSRSFDIAYTNPSYSSVLIETGTDNGMYSSLILTGVNNPPDYTSSGGSDGFWAITYDSQNKTYKVENNYCASAAVELRNQYPNSVAMSGFTTWSGYSQGITIALLGDDIVTTKHMESPSPGDDNNRLPMKLVINPGWNYGSVSEGMLSLSKESASANDSVVVSLRGSALNNIGALTLNLEFDPQILDFGRALNLNPKLSGAIINAKDGKVAILWEKLEGASFADEKIVDLKFLYKGSANPTNLGFIQSECDITDVNAKAVSVNYTDGLVTLGTAISGKLSYRNTNATPMDNFNVNLLKSNVVADSKTTDTNGDYKFNNVQNGSYNLRFSTSKPWGGGNATDALWIRLYLAWMKELDSLQIKAADVNGSKTISTTDGLLIKRRAAGLDNTFKIADWVFEESTLLVNGTSLVQNIRALCAGDVNGSYNPPLGKSSPKMAITNQGKVSVDDDRVFTIPVEINDNCSLGAVTLLLTYPERILEVKEVRSPKLEDFLYKADNGKIKFVWDNIIPSQFKPAEKLIEVTFRIKQTSYPEADFGIKIEEESEFADQTGKIIEGLSLNLPKLAPFNPSAFNLRQNYPNPFNPTTVIEYDMPEDGRVSLEVFNLLGEKVVTLVDELKPAGSYKAEWNAMNRNSGIYIYRLNVSGSRNHYSQIRKMMLIK